MYKTIKILSFLLIPLIFGCSDNDDGLKEVANMGNPGDLSMDFKITQDNTGLVTITPSGSNATLFQVDFGDGTEVSDELRPGTAVQHVYTEGIYSVKLMAKNLAGERSEVTQELEVSFRAPENLEVTITKDATNPFLVNVTAAADYETFFEVHFGENPNAEPISFLEGETASYQYAETGTYTVTVIAFSGGVETTTYTEEIEIFNPVLLPIDFENPDLQYLFYYFGGGDGQVVQVVNNPNPGGVNSSSKVGSYTKPSGSEVWAGSVITLNENIDFSGPKLISIDVYSPAAGIPVILKVENGNDGGIAAEATVNTTVANQWERLVFELPADASQTYSKVVLFFNFGTPGAGETYYFDNIQKLPLSLPLDFDTFDPSAYVFTGFGGATSFVEANPHNNEQNPSAHVVRSNKAMNAETWGGTFIDLDERVQFSNGNKIRLKVWSPQAGIDILVKFENPTDNSQFVEAVTTLNTANAWETIEVDFTGQPEGNWSRMVFFFDFNETGTGTDYYFDDVEQTN
ncbi:PKD domain-containing protein [Moheibacter sediminis]|uniref:PKD/Chitinase domain-containing protein n=1 Tax=Moheibacter sediminis TaxID=1434700 RepID=A0A1W2CGZ9_9FLAO|nr:PKD domain-containing protein [Moheibacter sediminis]SMC84469.1 hypothetical protein SAMN06296427_11073 [Moheibacter sediminis]